MTRVVLAGELPGLARQLRDLGVEVVYIGQATPEQVAAVVIQEDPDAVAFDGQAHEIVADIPVLSAADILTWVGERSHRPG